MTSIPGASRYRWLMVWLRYGDRFNELNQHLRLIWPEMRSSQCDEVVQIVLQPIRLDLLDPSTFRSRCEKCDCEAPARLARVVRLVLWKKSSERARRSGLLGQWPPSALDFSLTASQPNEATNLNLGVPGKPSICQTSAADETFRTHSMQMGQVVCSPKAFFAHWYSPRKSMFFSTYMIRYCFTSF
jgi:hypothetical protein